MATKITPEDFVDAYGSWTVLDVKQALDLLKEKYGIEPAAATAVMAAPAGGGEAAPVEEQTEFTVILTGPGDKKIEAIKAVRELTGLGLKEAKDLVDSAPKPVKENVGKEEAEQTKARLEAAGAGVEVK